jgi:hypothetical protein
MALNFAELRREEIVEEIAKAAAASVGAGPDAKQGPYSTEELVTLLVNEAVCNGWVDEELEENMLVGFAKLFGLKVKNLQHAEAEEDNEEEE